jgi:hypothetical protein
MTVPSLYNDHALLRVPHCVCLVEGQVNIQQSIGHESVCMQSTQETSKERAMLHQTQIPPFCVLAI